MSFRFLNREWPLIKKAIADVSRLKNQMVEVSNSPVWRRNLTFYLAESTVERCTFNRMAGARLWNGFDGSSVKYLLPGLEMSAEPTMTNIIGEGREAIRSGIERQIKARMINVDGGKRSEQGEGAMSTPIEK